MAAVFLEGSHKKMYLNEKSDIKKMKRYDLDLFIFIFRNVNSPFVFLKCTFAMCRRVCHAKSLTTVPGSLRALPETAVVKKYD